MALNQLIYVSSATRKLDESDLAKILESAVRNNSVNDVTGMLLYASGNFLQVLEGAEAAVNETFSRISEDGRHQDIIEISREPVPSRDFVGWAMGFRGISANDAKALPGYAPFFENGFKAATIGARPGLALDLLKTFAANNA
jgi:hypothetical protein